MLIVLLLTPFIIWWLGQIKGWRLWRRFLLASFIAYVLIILTATLTDYHLQAVLQSYDLDGNGWFTDDEQTAEQEQAMRAVISDTGRRLAPITGLIFAPCGVAVVFGVCYLLGLVAVFVQKFKKRFID
ncbi:hypothetical protein [Moraxella marmotae]|uniref:hypothetical protein n=1 Tax=Moraxella marmotae TaxID=3344520 RepID=UPI0035F3AA0B